MTLNVSGQATPASQPQAVTLSIDEPRPLAAAARDLMRTPGDPWWGLNIGQVRRETYTEQGGVNLETVYWPTKSVTPAR